MKGFRDAWRFVLRGSDTDRGGASELDENRPIADGPGKASIVESMPGFPYKKGDVIGEVYEVQGILGAGGFGIVYLVYHHQTESPYALKTFRDEYLRNQGVKERFRREANVWMDLDRHPYLVRAYFVDEVSGRLYIGTEYIAPNDQGLNSLEGYLQHHPPDLAQSLRWSIQLCHGMEYAHSSGIRSHRDLKPANILISQDGAVKITDFGLAAVLASSEDTPVFESDIRPGKIGLSWQTMEGAGCGTPTHMPPEQFVDAINCDERSDIYSRGVVLFQMASGGKLPFLPPMPRKFLEKEKESFWWRMHELHRGSPVPWLDSPMFTIIRRCLEKDPEKRYPTFECLRSDLEPVLKRLTGEVIRPPELKEFEVWECGNKGLSLDRLGRFGEAIRCYDRTLALDPTNVLAWTYKGNSLCHLGKHEEGIRFYDGALALDPLNVVAWGNKGIALDNLRRHEEAIRCYDEVLRLDPGKAATWCSKGNSLDRLGRPLEALDCYDKVLALDPRDAGAWVRKGNIFCHLTWFRDGLDCYDKALALDPRDAGAWVRKGNSLHSLRRFQEAVHCYDQALELDPLHAAVWTNKGGSLHELAQSAEAIRCFDRGLALDPQQPRAWYNKALTEDTAGRRRDATRSYKQFIAMAPVEYTAQIEYARLRLREFESN